MALSKLKISDDEYQVVTKFNDMVDVVAAVSGDAFSTSNRFAELEKAAESINAVSSDIIVINNKLSTLDDAVATVDNLSSSVATLGGRIGSVEQSVASVTEALTRTDESVADNAAGISDVDARVDGVGEWKVQTSASAFSQNGRTISSTMGNSARWKTAVLPGGLKVACLTSELLTADLNNGYGAVFYKGDGQSGNANEFAVYPYGFFTEKPFYVDAAAVCPNGGLIGTTLRFSEQKFAEIFVYDFVQATRTYYVTVLAIGR